MSGRLTAGTLLETFSEMTCRACVWDHRPGVSRFRAPDGGHDRDFVVLHRCQIIDPTCVAAVGHPAPIPSFRCADNIRVRLPA
tara:strand:+ start:2089 stop:2337 length:249 start_codon:yes stop_codon:yes gene_type:complete